MGDWSHAPAVRGKAWRKSEIARSRNGNYASFPDLGRSPNVSPPFPRIFSLKNAHAVFITENRSVNRMRVSSYAQPPYIPPIAPPPVPSTPPPASAQFLPFSAEAFDQARMRDVPVLLFISDAPPPLSDAALSMQIAERTVPVWLYPGTRPDVELLCQRAGALFSEEGALPLCALMLDDARAFLAAPLPPAGFVLDPSRLYVWLSQADRRFAQNREALIRQAAQTVRSFRAEPLRKPYTPHDAAHDLARALSAVHDAINGGFGKLKQPLVPALRFLSRAAINDHQARAALDQTLEAMLASDLYDPLDGAFFRATLTEDWRVFVPEKPLALNALLALTLLESGRRAEAVRALDFLLSACSMPGGMLNPCLTYSRADCAFTPEQVCAALGGEDGLRACRLLGLRRQYAGLPPKVTPSRFSPVEDAAQADLPRTPTLPKTLTPENAAFLRRVTPQLLRIRAARTPPTAAPCVLTEDCALAATVFALCGRRLGETRYIQAAQRAVGALTALSPGLPPSYTPVSALNAQLTCGAGAALSLALLTLGQDEALYPYRESGLRLLGASLHLFTTQSGMPMHTPQDAAAFFPRMPAIFDSELPSPAALMLHALALADSSRPEAGYREAAYTLWDAAAPYARQQPLACAGLIDAANFILSESPEAPPRPR